MSNEIQHKDLYTNGLNHVTQSDWVKVAGKLEIDVLRGNNGSHYLTFRDPAIPAPEDIKGMITTVMPNLYKQANKEIFSSILNFGKRTGRFGEEEIWKALKKL